MIRNLGRYGFAIGILVVLLIANLVMNPARFAPGNWGTLIGLAAPLIGAALASTGAFGASAFCVAAEGSTSVFWMSGLSVLRRSASSRPTASLRSISCSSSASGFRSRAWFHLNRASSLRPTFQ